MPNEFVARNGIIALASSIVTGSVTATQGFTGSLFGTSSWATNAATSSFILNAVSSSFAATASSADNFLVRGTLTAQTIVAQTITSSTDFVTGSTRFGTLLTNTHVFSGSVTMNPGGLFVSSSGLVGIGTTSPALPLTIFNSNAATLYQTAGTGTGGGNGFYVGHTGNVSYVYNYNAFPLVLATNNTERMRIDSGGNVGIGSTSPQNTFVVNGSQRSYNGSSYEVIKHGTFTLNDGTAGNFNHFITIGTTNVFATSVELTLSEVNIGHSVIKYTIITNYDDLSSTTKRIVLPLYSTNPRYEGAGGTYGGAVHELQMWSDGSGTMFLRLVAKTGGSGEVASWYWTAKLKNCDITDTPNTTGIDSGSYGIYKHTQITQRNSNVGIGTTSPNEKLVIHGNSARIKIQTASDSASYYTYLESNYNASNSFNIVDGGTNKFGSKALLTYNDTYVNSFYNVYIATGTATNSSASNIRLFVSQSGNVGIGTTSPSAKLDVETSAAGYAAIIKNTSAGGDYLKMIGDSGNTVFEFGSGGTGGEGFINIYSDAVQKILFDANGHSYFNAGNVGIGTTSPAASLHIEKASQDNILAVIGQSGYEGALFLSAAGSGKDANIVVGNGRNLEFHTTSSATPVVGGTAQMTLTATGNLGIGTTSPGAKLHISSSTVNDALLITTPNNNSSLYPFFLGGATLTSGDYLRANASIIEFFRNGGPSTIRTVGSTNNLVLQSATNLIFNTNGANEYARIDSSGNVGIGTTSPAAKLDVSGNVRATSFTGSFSGSLTGLASNATTASFASTVAGGTANYIPYWSATNTLGNSIIYQNTNTIGINTTSPTGSNMSSLLHINGAAAVLRVGPYYSTGGDRDFIELTAGGTDTKVTSPNERFWIENTAGAIIISASANVGIGVTSPATALDIRGRLSFTSASASTIFAERNGNYHIIYSPTGNPGIYIGNASDTANYYDNGSHQFRSAGGGTYYAVITSAGSVGIGTTSPTARLHVSGTTGGVFEVDGAAAVNALYVSASGRIGIGNITPGYTLDVTGNIHTTTTMYIDASNAAYLRGGDDHEWWDINVANTVGLYGVSNSAVGAIKLGSGGPTLYGASGNLGIGTTSPGQALDVNGRIRIGSNAQTEIYSSSNRVVFRGENTDNVAQFAGYGIFLPITGQAYNLYQAGSTLLGYTDTTATLDIARGSSGAVVYVRLNSNGNSYLNGGNVGIGTTAPAYKLEVNGATGISGQTTITSDSTEQVTIRTVTNTNRQLLIGYNYTPNYGYIQAVEQGTAFRNLLLNPSGGNVGIGTTSPGYKLDVAGVTNSTAFNVGNYTSYGFTIAGPGPAFGNGRSYIRLHTTASGARIVSFKIRLSTTWNYVPGFGYIDADVSYYFDGTIFSNPSVNVISATGQALNSIAIGDLVIESGYISLPVYITDSNSLFVKVEGSPSFDYSLITTTAWSSVTFPGSNAVYIAGRLGIGTASTSYPLEIASTNALSIAYQRTGVSAKKWGFQSDNDSTYWYNITDNVLALTVRNTGLIGIGTTSPGEKLHVVGNIKLNNGNAIYLGDSANNNGGRIYVDTGTNNFYINQANNAPLYFATNNGTKATILGNGNFGIGTTNPSYKLHITETTSADCRLQIENTSTGNAGIEIVGGGGNQYIDFTPVASTDFEGRIIYSSSSDEMQFMTNITNRFKLNSNGAEVQNGALGVGVAANSTDGRIDASNDIVAYSSDKRLKTNIQSIENPLDKIGKLSGFTYNWNDKAAKLANYDTNESLIGVFAQEVQAVLPEAVKLAPFDNDGNNKSISGENYLTVQYEKIVPLLIEAIKEQQKQIDDLKYLLSQK